MRVALGIMRYLLLSHKYLYILFNNMIIRYINIMYYLLCKVEQAYIEK